MERDTCQADQILLEAKNELAEEACKEYKEQLKSKLRLLRNANKVVANLKREVEDLQIKIKEELE